jgi:pimeloyl-ACP methyl ester carboxylesterase
MHTNRLLLLTLAICAITQSCSHLHRNNRARSVFKEAGIPVRMDTFTSGGHDIHYVTAGNPRKPTLFFIHGSPANWHCFENYMMDKDLLRRYRIVSIDRPGFGSSVEDEGISICRQAELLGPLLKKLQNGKPFYVIGHSLGGPLAVKVGAMYPKQISGLVLLAAAVDPDEERPEVWRYAIISTPVHNILPADLRNANFEMWLFKSDVNTIPSDLHNIKCPVTIMQGLIDHSVPPGQWVLCAKRADQCTGSQTCHFRIRPP